MKIHEAIQKAFEVGGYIRRRTWNHPFASKVLPTNTPECCIIMRWDGKNPCRGWEPTVGDLMADDWTIVTDDPSAKPDFSEFEQPQILPVGKKQKTIQIGVDVDTVHLDAAIEKANRLVELLEEASNLIDSLSGGRIDVRSLAAEACTALQRDQACHPTI